MSGQMWEKVGSVVGIMLALVLIKGGSSLYRSLTTPPSVGRSGAVQSTGAVGPREAQLNAAIQDCENRGALGRTLLLDRDVQASIARARSICRNNDAMFGRADAGSDTEANNAVGDVYTAMINVQQRYLQNLQRANESR